jgi:signal transduction histidine kinase
MITGLVTLYSLRQTAEEHHENRRVLTLAFAESLVGAMRPPEEPRLRAAADAVTRQEGVDIIGVRIDGQDGSRLVTSGEWPPDAIETSGGMAMASLTVPMVMRSDITYGNVVLGRLSVAYRPIGMAATVRTALVSISLIMLFAVLLSTAWATWTMSRTVAQPVAGMRDAAVLIAEGRRDVPLPVDRDDELGALARGIEEMMVQLEVHEREIIDSYRALEGAYKWQARLKGDLETALRTRSDFLAVASHEIRSPLSVIRMYTEMLHDGEFGPLQPQQMEAADSMINAATRLTSIVADILDVALLERGVMPLRFGPVLLDALLEGAVRDIVTLGHARDVDVSLLPCPSNVRIRGDETRIRQIIDNLLTNAIKYTNRSTPVTVSLEEVGDFAEVRVTDQGPGIPPDLRETLFEMFSRIETEDDAAASGLGLGLAISRRIARAHGGDLQVTDNTEAGRGTVFVLRLPYHGGDAVEAAGISVA